LGYHWDVQKEGEEVHSFHSASSEILLLQQGKSASVEVAAWWAVVGCAVDEA